MGRYKNGITGPFSGKIGPVVGSSWKGINYMRSRPVSKKNAKPSTAQQNQRNKISVTGVFMQSMKDVVTYGFDDNAAGTSAYNNATSYLMKNALDTATSPYSIRYSRVLITRGEYPGAENAAATAGEAGQISFNWTDDTGLGVAKANDKVLLVAYSPAENEVIFTSNNATRSAKMAILNVNPFKGQTVETYIAFLKADGSDVSSSIYAGQITVTT